MMVRLGTAVTCAALAGSSAAVTAHHDHVDPRHGLELHEPLADSSSSIGPSSGQNPASNLSPPPPVAHYDELQPPDDNNHGHAHGHPTVAIPEAKPSELVPIPWIPGGGAGTHDHKGAHAPVLPTLNETLLFFSAGPEPLSYIEWDYNYGMGRDEQVARFTAPEALAHSERMMGQVNGIWRTLIDAKHLSETTRKRVEHNLASYVPDDGHIRRHKRLMAVHVLGCVLATLVLCPLALALKAGHSSLAPLVCLLYLCTLGGSIMLGQVYNALTPPLYPSNSHGKMGHVMFWVSVVALGKDVVQLLFQIWNAARSAMHMARSDGAGAPGCAHVFESSHSKWMRVVRVALGQDQPCHPEKHEMLLEERNAMMDPPPLDLEAETHHPASPVSALIGDQHGASHGGAHSRSGSTYHSRASPPVHQPPYKTTWWQKGRTVLRFTHVVVNRSLPLLGFACSYTGLAIYTGTCRGSRVNTCAAHGIKGAIFFWYGLLTWARYLGAYAEFGWAWNRKPTLGSSRRSGISHWRRNAVSGEFIECMVIFVYGVTNTWMERLGSSPNDPYTIKQIQHISIAVMFWFGGLVGLLLETRRSRDLLNFTPALNHPAAVQAGSEPSRDRGVAKGPDQSGSYSLEGVPAQDEADALVNRQPAPPSYISSFNPFPAVIIGLTGSAMAAHHQDYQYEVQIHVLWGNALAAFGLFRLLTYVFLWLRPPTSILPSRPPTEALAAFCLAGGGLAFMLSSEEVSFAAMRGGYDDVMAILCFLVATVCLCFCFAAILLLVKGWALRREFRLVQQHARGLRYHDTDPFHHESICSRGTSSSSGGYKSVPGEEIQLHPVPTAPEPPSDPLFVMEEEHKD